MKNTLLILAGMLFSACLYAQEAGNKKASTPLQAAGTQTVQTTGESRPVATESRKAEAQPLKKEEERPNGAATVSSPESAKAKQK